MAATAAGPALPRHWLVLLFCVWLAACGTLSSVGSVPLGGDQLARPSGGAAGLRQEVDALVLPLIALGQTPGMVVGVLSADGATAFFGYGTIAAAGAATPDADTLFAIGSLSKGFIGALAGLLVDEGLFAWDDTLADLLPPGTPLSAAARKITLLELATHTSGLPRQPVNATLLQQFLVYLFTGDDFYKQFDRDFVFAYLAHFGGGERGVPRYSNVGYGILGDIIEVRSGLSVEELLQRRIVAPLGLLCTGYSAAALPCYAGRAQGHAGDQPKFIGRGKVVPDWQFTKFMRGSAGLHSNARDLLAFARAHLRGDQSRFNALLADTLRIRVERPQEAAAVAWIADEIGSQRVVYQIGLVAGYSSYIGVDVEQRTAVVVLQNSFNWSHKVGHSLLRHLAVAAR